MTGSTFAAALGAERRKTTGARVVATTTVLLVAGVALLAGALTMAATHGNQQVLDQLGPLSNRTGWPLLTGVVAQVTAAAAVLGFGVALGWMFGREFTDGTITGLFALPVSRTTIAAAKIAVYLLWALAVATLLTVLLGVVGLALRLGPLTGDVLAALARQHVLTCLSAVVALPTAWAATLGRGPLPGIATAVGLIVIAQVMVVGGTGAWFPVAAPALWALRPDAVSPVQLTLVATIPLVLLPVLLTTWHRLQLDR